MRPSSCTAAPDAAWLAATTRRAQSSSVALGRSASCTTATWRGWMHSLAEKPWARARASSARSSASSSMATVTPATGAAMPAARDALRALIVEAFATLSCEQVLQRLEDAQIANAQLRDMAGFWQHEQLSARERWRSVDTPAGAVPTLLPPGSWDDGDPRLDAVPALGQHTDAILGELGLDAPTIATLRAEQAI